MVEICEVGGLPEARKNAGKKSFGCLVLYISGMILSSPRLWAGSGGDDDTLPMGSHTETQLRDLPLHSPNIEWSSQELREMTCWSSDYRVLRSPYQAFFGGAGGADGHPKAANRVDTQST